MQYKEKITCTSVFSLPENIAKKYYLNDLTSGSTFMF